MSTTRRRGHTRRTPNGKRVKVRPHRVDHAGTARAAWEATGLSRLTARHGLNLIRNGADRTNEGTTVAQRLSGGLFMLGGLGEIGAVWATQTTRFLGLLGIAAIFGGVALARGDLKPKPAPRKQAAPKPRPVHVYGDEKPPARKPRVLPGQSDRTTILTHDTARYRLPSEVAGQPISRYDLDLLDRGGDDGLRMRPRHKDGTGVWRWGLDPRSN